MNAPAATILLSHFTKSTSSSDEAPDRHCQTCNHCFAVLKGQAGAEVLATHLLKECNSIPDETRAEITQQLHQRTPLGPPPPPRNQNARAERTAFPATAHATISVAVEDYLYLVRDAMHRAFAEERWREALAPYEISMVAESVALFLASPWITAADKDRVMQPLKRAFERLDFEDQIQVQQEDVGVELMARFGRMATEEEEGDDDEAGGEGVDFADHHFKIEFCEE